MFGSISIDGIKEAKSRVPAKFQSHEKYGNQLKVSAVEFEDGNISLSIWDADKKEAIKLGTLMTSTLDDAPKAEPKAVKEDDLPF